MIEPLHILICMCVFWQVAPRLMRFREIKKDSLWWSDGNGYLAWYGAGNFAWAMILAGLSCPCGK